MGLVREECRDGVLAHRRSPLETEHAQAATQVQSSHKMGPPTTNVRRTNIDRPDSNMRTLVQLLPLNFRARWSVELPRVNPHNYSPAMGSCQCEVYLIFSH